MTGSERRAGGLLTVALAVCAVVAALAIPTLHPAGGGRGELAYDGAHLRHPATIVGAARDVRVPAPGLRRTGTLLLVSVGAALALVLVRYGLVAGDGVPLRSRVERRRNRTRAPPVAS